MRTIHETLKETKIIKLTYHGKSHFNSLKDIKMKEVGIFKEEFGIIEDLALINAKKLSDLRKNIKEKSIEKDPEIHPEIY